ncbi:hypothetical protein DPMN_044839 [Dreissena polymorpha]|uniref:Uncharacterized protein n=1 Tax=Dreissena polymorpha TaxID=45954 RepID=A0A9D4D2Z5_DREPO|nr:hypothetical protein DPMN_044839 [Dreissena polymorpha]
MEDCVIPCYELFSNRVGGTIDMTVHEVCFGGALKELHKATGGAWGGTMVDTAFLDFIAELMGKVLLLRNDSEWIY